MKLIDTHAHIYLDQFKKDLPEIIENAKENGIHKVYLPNIDHTTIDAMLSLEEKYPGFCIPMMGLHPGSVKKDFEKELYIIEGWLKKRKFAAVGEIGIDLYWDKTFAEEQAEAFKIQIEWAKEFELPIVIHNRESFSETFEIVKKAMDEKLKGIFHCFTGTKDEAEKITDINFYCGIGGVLTFKKSDLANVLKDVDLNYMVLETDSPYLAPVPFRGKRNQPSHVRFIAEKLAEAKGIPTEEIARHTSANAEMLFQI